MASTSPLATVKDRSRNKAPILGSSTVRPRTSITGRSTGVPPCAPRYCLATGVMGSVAVQRGLVNFWQENHRFYELENRSVAQSIYPLMNQRLSELQARSVLDFGCGDGRLLEALQGPERELAGFDISPQGRELARARLGERAHIFGPPDAIPDASYDAVVNSMVLMTLPDKAGLAAALRELALCLRPGGTILSAVTHPCFRGRKFSDFATGWVDGADSYFSEGHPFRVTLFDERAGLSVTFDDYHYSVSAYFNAIVDAGLALTALYELPDPSPQAPGAGTYPAFLVLEARRP